MRAAIIDTHHDRTVVVEVGHLDLGAEGQAPVGRGQGVLVERFTTGSSLAMVLGAVIGRGAGFVVAVGVDEAAGATGQQGGQGQEAE